MQAFDHQLLTENPRWQQVLRTYLSLAAEAPARAEAGSGPRWAARIESLEEIAPEELATIHGQLIAQGWLTIQLEDGRLGLSYRVSSDGRAALQLLERGTAPVDADDESDREEA